MEGASGSNALLGPYKLLIRKDEVSSEEVKKLKSAITNFGSNESNVIDMVVDLCNFLLLKSLEGLNSGAGSVTVNKLEFKSNFKKYTLTSNEYDACNEINKVAHSILFSKRGVTSSLKRVDSADFEAVISWKSDNLYLIPKPMLPELSKSFSYCGVWWDRYKAKDLVDVEFRVESEVFAAHKLILSASPVLHAMFIGMNDARLAEPITLKIAPSKEVFKELMRHLYTTQVDESFLKDPNKTIDLLNCANALQIDSLEVLCAKTLEQMIGMWIKEAPIKPQAVLDIAIACTKLKHKGLIQVCHWFFRVNPEFHNTKDLLKDRSMEQIFTMIDTANDIGYKGLKEVCFQHLKDQITRENFAIIASRAIDKKEDELRKICKNFIRDDKQNYDHIYEGRKDGTKKKWDLYKLLSLLPTDHETYSLKSLKDKEKELKS